MNKIRTRLALAACFVVVSCAARRAHVAHDNENGARAPTADDGGLSNLPLAADGLPTSPEHEEFVSFLRGLNLNDGSWSFEDGAGGMSINLEFSGNGQRGDFISANADGCGDNGSGHPEGQVVSYNLSRILGYSRSFGRGHWYKIGGRAKDKLRDIGEARAPTNIHVRKAKERLKQTVLQSEVHGSISLFGPAPKKMKAWERRGEANGVFETNHAFASFIKARGTRPQNRNVDLYGFTVNELDAAKMLSTLMLVDALVEQFDRFSGDNIAVVKDGSLYRVVSYDNNGAACPGFGTAYVGRYIGWVSRFDRQAALRIVAMDRFVNGSDARFLGFTDKNAFLRTLGLRKLTTRFKGYLARVATHIRTTLQSSGEAAFF